MGPPRIPRRGGLVVSEMCWTIDTVPTEFATHAPRQATPVAPAVASHRLRPPAAIGAGYLRGEGT